MSYLSGFKSSPGPATLHPFPYHQVVPFPAWLLHLHSLIFTQQTESAQAWLYVSHDTFDPHGGLKRARPAPSSTEEGVGAAGASLRGLAWLYEDQFLQSCGNLVTLLTLCRGSSLRHGAGGDCHFRNKEKSQPLPASRGPGS
nr:uncharacterized protein LOC110568557 [Aotus nancymaae]